jgi:hypothetical protein
VAHREVLEDWLLRHGEDPAAEQPPRAHLDTAADAPEAAGRHPLADAGESPPGRAGDLAALRADYDLEDEAVAIYGHFAYQAEDRELMQLFKELARSESGHRNGLRRTIREVNDPDEPLVLFCPLCGWEIDFGPHPAEGAVGKCRMCPGRFALRLGEDGDWTLERLAP